MRRCDVKGQLKIEKSQFEWSDILQSGDRLFIGSNAAVPSALITDMLEKLKGVSDIEVVHILTLDEPVWAQPNIEMFLKLIRSS